MMRISNGLGDYEKLSEEERKEEYAKARQTALDLVKGFPDLESGFDNFYAALCKFATKANK